MKLSENNAQKRLFRFALKRKGKIGSETKRNEAKRKNFGSKTKRKYALLISFWSEAKSSEKKREKKFVFSREFAKCMRNGSRFASLRFEATNFFLRNRRTL
jgi:hypothetical protein